MDKNELLESIADVGQAGQDWLNATTDYSRMPPDLEEQKSELPPEESVKEKPVG